MNNSINPYETSSKISRQPVLNKKNAFLAGARNGFLWSVLLAVPASFAFYSAACLGLTHQLDPVNFARTKISLTNAHRIVACYNSCVTAAGYIVLPWSLVAGVVKHVVSNRNKDKLGLQGNERENT